MSYEFSNPTTSTPNSNNSKRTEHSSPSPSEGSDKSSSVLRGLLGVSPVSAPPHLRTNSIGNRDSTKCNMEQEAASNKGTTFRPTSNKSKGSKNSNSSKGNSNCGGTGVSTSMGIMRSGSLGNSNLSLQQVIQRIIGGKESNVKADVKVTRSRSYSMSDVPTTSVNMEDKRVSSNAKSNDQNITSFSNKSVLKSDSACTSTLRAVSTTNISEGPTLASVNSNGKIVQGKSGREGTPESDSGYASIHSTSPDSLSDLLKAMKINNNSSLPENPIQDRNNCRPKLPSISELDPAVSHVVKSQNFYADQTSYQSPNLVNSIFGFPPNEYGYPYPRTNEFGYPHTYELHSQVGTTSLLSDRQHVNSLFATHPNDPASLERAAKLYRNAASLYEASCTWSGQLPPRNEQNPVYSTKIFLGGVPWDITERCLAQAFCQFGSIRIEWPGKGNSPSPPKGYLYVIFENEAAVTSLLSQCTFDYSPSGGCWYFRISSRRMRSKEVQIIPWMLGDSNFVRCPSQRLDPQTTVFVGALHGMLNAEGLAHIFNDLFGSVVYAGIDTDRFKYPIGSGRVTFSNSKSYMKAVAAAFIEIKTFKFTKKVQVDPYLEDALCSNCLLKQGPYFCRDISCFKYYCRYCWELHHSVEVIRHHKPLMRNNRNTGSAVYRPFNPISVFPYDIY